MVSSSKAEHCPACIYMSGLVAQEHTLVPAPEAAVSKVYRCWPCRSLQRECSAGLRRKDEGQHSCDTSLSNHSAKVHTAITSDSAASCCSFTRCCNTPLRWTLGGKTLGKGCKLTVKVEASVHVLKYLQNKQNLMERREGRPVQVASRDGSSEQPTTTHAGCCAACCEGVGFRV